MGRSYITVARYKARQDISASTTTAATAAGVGAQTYMISVHNLSAVQAHVISGDSSITATTSTGVPIAAGQFMYIQVSPGEYVAAILASSTGTIAVVEWTN